MLRSIQTILFTVMLGLLLSGCSTAATPTPTAYPASMKGYELYSWQDGNQWKFSLLIGTNREKSLAEIKSPDTALTGLDALTSALKRVPSGQYVTWSSKDTLAFPPDDIIQKVKEVCKAQGLILNVAR
jgi:hypothetical protein